MQCDILMQGALSWHPAPKPLLEAATEARKKADAHGVDIATLAIKQAVKPPGIVTLVGMRTPEEVDPCQCTLPPTSCSSCLVEPIIACHQSVMLLQSRMSMVGIPSRIKLWRHSEGLYGGPSGIHVPHQ
jgi:hypothetical protein